MPSSKAETSALEEHVAGHFAGQERTGFLHLGLDEAVAGFPQQRTAAVRGSS